MKEKIISEFSTIPEISRGGMALPDPIMIWEPVGCSKCKRQGFSGGWGFLKTLEMTAELGEIVLKNLSESALGAEARRQGLITMRQDGF